jgi:hypothetical protein
VHDKRLVLRRMTEADLALALEWAAAESCNSGLHDAHCFYAADPEGFFLAELDGVLIGCVSAVRYAAGFGFLGLYIVKAEHRGRGSGLELWRTALDHLGDRVIGLDEVVAQQENYRKSGFRLAFRNIRQQGRGGGAAPPGLTDLAAIPIEEILRYDETVFPAQRTEFLRSWLGQPQAVAFGAVDGRRLKGYVFCGRCGANVPGSCVGSRSENRIPNLGSRVALGAQSTEFELTLPDPMHKFDAGGRRCGLVEMLEAEHRTEPKLDGSMILFDQIVQIF